MKKYIFKILGNLFRKRTLLNDEQKRYLKEKTIIETEKALDRLKKEEQEARKMVDNGLRDIFNDLPILI